MNDIKKIGWIMELWRGCGSYLLLGISGYKAGVRSDCQYLLVCTSIMVKHPLQPAPVSKAHTLHSFNGFVDPNVRVVVWPKYISLNALN